MYSCEICGKTFIARSSRWRHKKEVHGGKSHDCRACGDVFSRSSSLYRHQATGRCGGKNTRKCDGASGPEYEDTNDTTSSDNRSVYHSISNSYADGSDSVWRNFKLVPFDSESSVNATVKPVDSKQLSKLITTRRENHLYSNGEVGLQDEAGDIVEENENEYLEETDEEETDEEDTDEVEDTDEEGTDEVEVTDDEELQVEKKCDAAISSMFHKGKLFQSNYIWKNRVVEKPDLKNSPYFAYYAEQVLSGIPPEWEGANFRKKKIDSSSKQYVSVLSPGYRRGS